jgi:hypothetical protein
MIKIIREGNEVEHQEFNLIFDTNPTGGYSFPCNHLGEVDESILSDCAKVNLESCRNGEVKTIRPPYVRECIWHQFQFAVGECEECGEEVELRPDYEGLCYCACGKCYNSAGQSIRPRSEWEERYDDDY